jgi:hypothetical protein
MSFSSHRTRARKWFGLSRLIGASVGSRAGPPAIDRHHGRNGMFENKLHAWTRLQQNCKLVKAGQLTTQPDAVHEEHVYGGLVLYERLQKVVLYAPVCSHVLRSMR